LSVTDKQEPSPDEIAQNFDATREQLLNKQKDQIFRVYMATLVDKYKKAGGIHLTKAVAEDAPLGKKK